MFDTMTLEDLKNLTTSFKDGTQSTIFTTEIYKKISDFCKKNNIACETEDIVIKEIHAIMDQCFSYITHEKEFYIRKALVSNLRQKKITNPLNHNGFFKSNFSTILDYLWKHSDKEQEIFEVYSGILKSHTEYDNYKLNCYREYLYFFIKYFMPILENGTSPFNHNDKFYEYSRSKKGKISSKIILEALRILQTEEYIQCVGDGTEQRKLFTDTIKSVMQFLNV